MQHEEQRLRAELESEVRKKTAHLTRAIEELQLEIDGRKRMEVEIERTHRELLAASQQAGMVEEAARVLRNLGNLLKERQRLRQPGFQPGQTIQDFQRRPYRRHDSRTREVPGNFMSRHPRGQKLPVYIADLAEYLANEQTVLSKELESLKKSIEEAEAQTKFMSKEDLAKVAAPDEPHPQ